MTRTPHLKEISGKIPLASEARILELSLENPDFGARRLLPLLKRENIRVSTSTVYHILKRHDQENREKRLAKIEERNVTQEPVTKKTAARIPDEVAERIVNISLQYPEYGSRRLLPLLKEKDISVSASAVYYILKRNGLQSRDKRLLRIKKQQAIAIPAVLEDTDQTTEVIERESTPTPEPERASKEISYESGRPQVSLVLRTPAKSIAQRSLLLTLLNIVLLALLVFLGFHAWHVVHNALPESETTASSTPTTGPIDSQSKAAVVRSLKDYRIRGKRDPFNVAKDTARAPKQEISLDTLTWARKDIDLRLVGTVVADDPNLSRAFIDIRSTRRQGAYREGDKAADFQIKKILHNKVVIATDEGYRLLVVDTGDASKSAKSTTHAQQTSVGEVYPQQVTGRKPPRRSISLAREEVEASLQDIDELEQMLNIEPYVKNDQPIGFTLSRIPPQSILRQMGLNNGVAIMELNGEAITSPDQAIEFFQTLAQGGEITIKVRTGRGVRQRTRFIYLNIK